MASKTVIAVSASSAAMLVVMIAMLALPMSLVGASTHDFVALLDGAYRIERGLVPHIDFPVEHGPVPLYQALVALRLASYAPPFYTMEATSFLLLLPPAIQIALNQPDRARAAALILAVAAISFLPFLLLDNYLPGPEHAGIYNRASSAALFLVFVFSFTPKRVTWSNTLTLAYLLVLLFGIKITAAMIGLAVCFAAAIVSAPARTLLLQAMAIVLLLLSLANFYHGIIVGYFHNILQLMSLNRGSLAGRAFKQALDSAVPLSVAVVFALIAARSLGLFSRPSLSIRRPVTQLRRLRPLLAIVVILGATVVNESQNSGNVGLFEAFSLAFYRFPRLWNQRLVLIVTTVLVTTAVAPWLQVAARGAATALYHSRHMVKTPDISAIYPGGGTNDLDMAAATDFGAAMKVWLHSPPSAQEALAVQFADRLGSPASFIVLSQTVGEITKLARADRRITPESRVASLTEVQLFDRILGALPGKESNLWLDPSRTVNAADPNFARRYLQGVDIMFVPLCHFTPGERSLDVLMMPAVKEAFSLDAGTDCWQIWRRE